MLPSSLTSRASLHSSRWPLCRVLVLFALLAQPASGQSEERSKDVFDDFGRGWRGTWMVRSMAPRPTRYDVVSDGEGVFLRGTSAGSASALWRRLDIERPKVLKLSWRWRVEMSLGGNQGEKTKGGDDYAARLLVAFGADPFSRTTPALCYVWAAREPVGSTYPNPFAANVATIVIESGDERSGQWTGERRDVLVDFRAAFGGRPDTVAAIAVIVDTDNTKN